MHRPPLLDKEKGLLDPATWEPLKEQAAEQLGQVRAWIEKSPAQALGTAAVAGLVLGWIWKRL